MYVSFHSITWQLSALDLSQKAETPLQQLSGVFSYENSYWLCILGIVSETAAEIWWAVDSGFLILNEIL